MSAALSYHYSGLEAGERVLIHAGAGGVGTAAIQLAQAAGAEVFATASLPKHDFVRSLGVEHVYDSRQTAFGEQILEDTGGEGVHVLLNSLTSEGFIEAGLSCLAEGGRFVELARRDILTHEEMAAVRPDVGYDILELDVLKKTDPEWVGEVLREVMAQLSEGVLEPLIHSRWPLAEAGPALGFMRAARHLGKIVVTANPLARGRLRQDRTYLVTGGLGGIGCAVAEWLADRGAGTIVLNGRRDPDAEARETIEALRRKGIRVEVELADVTDIAALDAMLARMDAELPPLGGVIHSVGVLSDAALTNQTWESFERVLWPKIVGAWHLHLATRGRDLDLFVLFSSRVGVMGNPGQANHAAANAFLDQLAGHRRARGLAGQAIAWGAWSDIARRPSSGSGSSSAGRPSAVAGSRRSKASGRSIGWYARTAPTRWSCRWTGRCSRRPSRNVLPSSRTCCPRMPQTRPTPPPRKTSSPGWAAPLPRTGKMSWPPSWRSRSRPCSGCPRRRRPRSASSILVWTLSWRSSCATA